MARYYREEEMARLYQPADTVTFSRGAFVMTAETAERLTWGLVELDRPTGAYRRIQMDPGLETQLINEANVRARMLAPVTAAGNRLRL